MSDGGKKLVVVPGGGGYLGSVLSRYLLEAGYRVRCLERFYFGREPIAELDGNPDYEIIEGNQTAA